MRYPLKLHSASPHAPLERIEVEVERQGAALRLRYTMAGEMGELAVPTRATPGRADGLWRHSCMEAFVMPHQGAEYLEFNLSPSAQWAAYRFTGYRSGMEEYHVPEPSIRTAFGSNSIELEAELHLDQSLADKPWRVGLSTVFEAADGSLSYWALNHPPGKPDFHHRDCFALELAPAG